MRFECRYDHDWAYTKALTGHIRNRKRLRWAVLLVFCSIMLTFCLRVGTLHVLFSVYFALMIVFCLYRLFLWRRLSSRAQWERASQAAGTDRVETVFTLDGEGVSFSERGNPIGRFPWSACARVSDEGDWIAVTLKGKKRPTGATFFLPRRGFSDGTGAEFLAWLSKERPELVRSSGKK